MSEVAALVQEFADCVAAQSKVVLLGDPEKGNEYARRYIKAFESLREIGDTGRDALSGLLTDSRPDVRVMAASFLLRHCEEQARSVLEREAAGRGLVAFSAAQALRRWKDGTWDLDRTEGEVPSEGS